MPVSTREAGQRDGVPRLTQLERQRRIRSVREATHLPVAGPAANLDSRAVARVSIKALRDIEEGEELFVTYVQPSLGVRERRQELKSWGIAECKCSRCVREDGELAKNASLVDSDLANEIRQAFTF